MLLPPPTHRLALGCLTLAIATPREAVHHLLGRGVGDTGAVAFMKCNGVYEGDRVALLSLQRGREKVFRKSLGQVWGNLAQT